VAHVLGVRSGFRLRIEVAFAATVVAEAGDAGVFRLDRREVLAADFYELSELPADLMPNHRRLLQENADWFHPAAVG
jgi:hypothetical protein